MAKRKKSTYKRKAAKAAFQPRSPRTSSPRRRLFGQATSKVVNDMFTKETLLNHMKQELGDESIVLRGVEELKTLNRNMAIAKLIPLAVGGFMQYAKSYWGEEPNKIGSPDMGAVYTKCIEITEGARSDSQMRTAKKLYKSQNMPSFNSTSENYTDDYAYSAVYAAAGEGRQGVWVPTTYNQVTGFPSAFNEAAKATIFQSQMMTQLFLWAEIFSRLLSADDINWLDNTSGTNQASADRYYAIDYIEDIVTIANAMEFSNCELTIYLCKCKMATKYSPAQSWFVPQQDPAASTRNEYMRSEYVYHAPAENVNFPGELAKTNAQPCFPHANVHVGATPFYSPRFRQTWEVVDVIKREIKSTDKLVLKIKRKFRKVMSARDLDLLKDTIGHAHYNNGDYGLIITFKGTQGFMKYDGPTDPGTYDQRIREVDVGPSKIVVNQRHSFGLISPDYSTSAMQPPAADKTSNYIAGEGRVLDTTIRTRPFNDTEWVPELVTNVRTVKGGPRD